MYARSALSTAVYLSGTALSNASLLMKPPRRPRPCQCATYSLKNMKKSSNQLSMYVCMYACMFVCMYVCMYAMYMVIVNKSRNFANELILFSVEKYIHTYSTYIHTYIHTTFNFVILRKFFVDSNCFPKNIALVQTRGEV